MSQLLSGNKLKVVVCEMMATAAGVVEFSKPHNKLPAGQGRICNIVS